MLRISGMCSLVLFLRLKGKVTCPHEEPSQNAVCVLCFEVWGSSLSQHSQECSHLLFLSSIRCLVTLHDIVQNPKFSFQMPASLKCSIRLARSTFLIQANTPKICRCKEQFNAGKCTGLYYYEHHCCIEQCVCFEPKLVSHERLVNFEKVTPTLPLMR